MSAVHWFTISGGPMARAYTTAAGTARWLTWRIRGRGEDALVPRSGRAYGEFWCIGWSSVNVVRPVTSGGGGRVSVWFARAAWALWVTLFFFSSRRRHTSSLRDWSSDVCSSD